MSSSAMTSGAGRFGDLLACWLAPDFESPTVDANYCWTDGVCCSSAPLSA